MCKFFSFVGRACPEFTEGKGVRGTVDRVFQKPAKQIIRVHRCGLSSMLGTLN